MNNYNEDCDKEEEEESDEKKGLKMEQSEKIKRINSELNKKGRRGCKEGQNSVN